MQQQDDKNEALLTKSGILLLAEKALVSEEKLNGYTLNQDHPVGKYKARQFEQVLGLTTEHVAYVKIQLLQGLTVYQAFPQRRDAYGQRFEVPMPLSGPKGRTIVITGWIVDASRSLRYLTARVAKRKEQVMWAHLLEEK